MEAYDVDVAIIGAGPAGSSCATELLRQAPGLRVALVEAIDRRNWHDPAYPGGGHSMCSGGLGKQMLEVIGWDIPRSIIMADVNRAVIRSPNHTAEVSGKDVGIEGPVGVVMDRRRLDDWLITQAMRAGADYRPGTRILHHKSYRRNGVWHLQGTRSTRAARVDAQENVQFSARWLIAADGPNSPWARDLGAPPLRDEDVFLGSEAYVRAPRFPPDVILIHFQASRGLRGYYWAFSAGPIVKAGCGTTIASGVNPGRETEWWRTQLATEWNEPGFTAAPVEVSGHKGVGGRITGAPPCRTVANDTLGLAVVGEAARAVWASVGAGDAAAIEGGRRLGAALAQRPLPTAAAYQKWWTRDAAPFLLRHWRIKEMLLGMDDAALDRAVRLLARYKPRSSNTRREVPRLVAWLALRDPGFLAHAARAAIRRPHG